jgi:hypothetical protein
MRLALKSASNPYLHDKIDHIQYFSESSKFTKRFI